MHSLIDVVRAAPGVAFSTYGKRSLIALSHAMEDRGIDRAAHPPLVFGGFQRARFFAHDENRYRHIAQASALTVAVAGGLDTCTRDRLAIVGVGPEDPFWYDWVLVVYGGGGHAAVLVARDHRQDDVDGLPTRDRRCDAVWAYDPRLAFTCARWVGRYLHGHDPALAARWTATLERLPPPSDDADQPLTAIGARLVESMQEQLAREQSASRALEASYEATIAALAQAAEARDRYTEEHLVRVAERSVAVGRVLGMTARQIEVLRTGARLHDVGKIGTPDAILSKPGRLTDDEMAEMRRHSVTGATIVSRVPGLRSCVPIVRHHHEAWDGTGYPDGLAGTDIPLGARVVAVVDAFDAMTTDRPYRPGMSHEEARARVVAARGTQFCPRCVDALLRVLDEEADRDPWGLAGLAVAGGLPEGG